MEGPNGTASICEGDTAEVVCVSKRTRGVIALHHRQPPDRFCRVDKVKDGVVNPNSAALLPFPVYYHSGYSEAEEALQQSCYNLVVVKIGGQQFNCSHLG